MTATAAAISTDAIISRHRRPDRNPWFIEAVMDEWWLRYQEAGLLTRETALPDSRVRASWAGSCARRIAYGVAGVEETNPTTVASAWNFALGQFVHDTVQEIILNKWQGAAEVKTRLGDVGSGHADMLIQVPAGVAPELPDGGLVCIELKSIGGQAFFFMTDPRNGEGAKFSAVAQGAINAAAMDPQPDLLVIPYFSKENISVGKSAKRGITNELFRFAAQWTFTKDEYLTIARDEMDRLARIVRHTDRNGPLSVPKYDPSPHYRPHVITNPKVGTMVWIDEEDKGKRPGSYWGCQYCPYEGQCTDDYRSTGK